MKTFFKASLVLITLAVIAFLGFASYVHQELEIQNSQAQILRDAIEIARLENALVAELAIVTERAYQEELRAERLQLEIAKRLQVQAETAKRKAERAAFLEQHKDANAAKAQELREYQERVAATTAANNAYIKSLRSK